MERRVDGRGSGVSGDARRVGRQGTPGLGQRGEGAPQSDGTSRGEAGRARAKGAKGRGSGSGGGAGRAKGMGQQGRPTGPLWPTVVRLSRYMRPHARALATVVVAILATTAIELTPPIIIRYGVDRLILRGEVGRIWWLAAGLVAVALVQGAIDFGRLYLNASIGQRIVFDLRNAVFQHLSTLSFSFFDRSRTGDLMSRATADVDVLSEFFGRAAVIVLTNLLTLVGILIILMTWNWRLGLLYLVFLPAFAHGMWIYAQRVRPAMGMARRKLADLTASLQETLAGIAVVKLMGREALQEHKADREAVALREANVEATRITSLWMPYVFVLMGVSMALVLWLGGLGVIQGVITLGTLIAFTSYVGMLMRPIRQTGMMLNAVMRSAAAAERVFEVLDIAPDVRDAPDAYPLLEVTGHVRYERVSFAYDGANEVLREVSLEARPGDLVALVGHSGSGKTTLVHLLPRFYEAQEGTITIDGHDVRKVTLKSLRHAIGIAMQDVYLFDASIGENIAYGNPHARQEEIERMARAVQMHEFIAGLPMGYGTPVGERGVRLSGGQKQRLALARVLLRDPRILILDEPTSSVDAETERRMQEALDEARAGRTTFIIAHRLWTVQEADQILVLREGRIVERARRTEDRSAHEVLLEAGGYYRELFERQLHGEALEPEGEVGR